MLDVGRRTSDVHVANWRFLKTAPLSGEDNMRFDTETLVAVEKGQSPSTFRFFRFSEPTVSYGRLQQLNLIQAQIPSAWPAVRRPTGGGIVLHQGDLCFSLCWPKNAAPLPTRTRDTYEWIHAVLLRAMGSGYRMATCADVCHGKQPFSTRECFTEPVGFDLLAETEKVVGGALRSTRGAVLYQGSIQLSVSDMLEAQIQQTFEMSLTSAE